MPDDKEFETYAGLADTERLKAAIDLAVDGRRPDQLDDGDPLKSAIDTAAWRAGR